MLLQNLKRSTQYVGLAKDSLYLKTCSSKNSRHAHRMIAQRMGKLRGLPQKIGQMLSFSNTGSPSNWQEYQPLCDSAQPEPWSVIQPLLEQCWGQGINKVLSEYDTEGKAASLGQVHRAWLHSGQEVAIKVQYPGIQQAVHSDLKSLGYLASPLGNLRKEFELGDYQRVIATDMQKELDYQLEATNQSEFYEQWQNHSSVVVPKVVNSLSNKNVLVTYWEDGQTWDEICNTWTKTDRRKLADVLLKFFLIGFFQNGLMQADWHPGNVRFRYCTNGPQLVLYDFGCLCKPSIEDRLALARLIQATSLRQEAPTPLLLKLGFKEDYLEPLEKKIPAICSVLFEPFAAEYPYDMNEWKLAERMQSILGDDRWNFRAAGPPELIFTLRAFQGLIHYMRGLAVARNWQTNFIKVIQPLANAMNGLELPCVNSTSDFRIISKSLQIRVIENGKLKVQITQAAKAIERLNELLDKEVKQRIAEDRIDLDEILEQVRANGYSPGPVFNLRKDNKKIEVNLL